jgi:hypothetical protein
LYFKDYEGFDFQIDEDSITIGIEPAYQFGDLKIVNINKDKGKSYYQSGRAFGYWGSKICSKTKYYKDYVRSSKFKNFIDKWQPVYAALVQ